MRLCNLSVFCNCKYDISVNLREIWNFKKRNKMGKGFSRLRGHLITRPVQRFNIEARTDTLLDADKPVPAPKHKSDLEARQKVLEKHWDQVDKDIKQKDASHSDRLKEVNFLRPCFCLFV